MVARLAFRHYVLLCMYVFQGWLVFEGVVMCLYCICIHIQIVSLPKRSLHGLDRMVVGFTTT
jgi:uncharacterized membrane protein